MKTVTTNVSFVKLFKEQSKKMTILWLRTAAGNVRDIAVYATDSNYENGKLIPDADVSPLNDDINVGFQFEYAIPFSDKGELEPYDYYFRIVATMDDKSEVAYDAHSFYKPDGNPGSEGDTTIPPKP